MGANAEATPKTRALRGRDLEAIYGFAQRLRERLPNVVSEVRFLGARTLDVPARAAAPVPRAYRKRKGRKAHPPPPPRPPSELQIAVRLTRRDVFVEEQIDEVASAVTRELGTVVAPFAYTDQEWDGRLRATRLGIAYSDGEVLR